MNRLEADFLVVDLIVHGAPVEYVLQRIVKIVVREEGAKE